MAQASMAGFGLFAFSEIPPSENQQQKAAVPANGIPPGFQNVLCHFDQDGKSSECNTGLSR